MRPGMLPVHSMLQIPGHDPGHGPASPPITECYWTGPSGTSPGPLVSRSVYSRTVPVPDLALTETLAHIAEHLSVAAATIVGLSLCRSCGYGAVHADRAVTGSPPFQFPSS